MKKAGPKSKIDCMNLNCPMPLIKTREAIMKAKKNDIIEVFGTHPDSYNEIPMALEALGIKILKRVKDDDKKWTIIFKV